MSDSEKDGETEVIKAVKDLGADMVDVLDAIHASLMDLNKKIAEMKGHLDLATALSLSERIGVSASTLGIEVSVPTVKTNTELDGKKTSRKTDTDVEEVVDKDAKERGDDSSEDDPCDDGSVCHYG
tara:strand:- start:1701 stop:2078 length:378 start_codon:yes stop_codon:yes gene_type:complete